MQDSGPAPSSPRNRSVRPRPNMKAAERPWPLCLPPSLPLGQPLCLPLSRLLSQQLSQLLTRLLSRPLNQLLSQFSRASNLFSAMRPALA